MYLQYFFPFLFFPLLFPSLYPLYHSLLYNHLLSSNYLSWLIMSISFSLPLCFIHAFCLSAGMYVSLTYGYSKWYPFHYFCFCPLNFLSSTQYDVASLYIAHFSLLFFLFRPPHVYLFRSLLSLAISFSFSLSVYIRPLYLLSLSLSPLSLFLSLSLSL